MGKTLHEKVPLKGTYGFASTGWAIAWAVAVTVFCLIIVQALK
jgi:hypothetical protein